MSRVQVKKQKGQGMVEYITIVALVGLGSLAAYSYFGQSVRGQTAQMSAQVAGVNGTAGQTQSANATTNANTEATAKIGLKNYDTHAN